MLLRTEHNAIIYKYNKYIQVSGSLFYAFEYLIKTLEANPESNIRFYILIASSQKKDYLYKLRKLFQTKYPLLREYKDRGRILSYKEKLTKEEYSTLISKIKILTEAFDRIITCSSIELLKLKFNKVMFINYNSWLNTSYKADTTFVVQNRNINSLDQSEFPKETSIKDKRIMFLYELPEQQFPSPFGAIQYQYNLSLATDYFIPKKLFESKDKTRKVQAGKPITNTSFETTQKPSLFIGVIDRPLLNTREIEYHQNFLKYDENCRIIIEARFYKVKIKVIKVETTKLRTMSNFIKFSSSVHDLETLPNDSSVTRLESDLSNYTLSTNDFIIQLLKD